MWKLKLSINVALVFVTGGWVTVSAFRTHLRREQRYNPIGRPSKSTNWRRRRGLFTRLRWRLRRGGRPIILSLFCEVVEEGSRGELLCFPCTLLRVEDFCFPSLKERMDVAGGVLDGARLQLCSFLRRQ